MQPRKRAGRVSCVCREQRVRGGKRKWEMKEVGKRSGEKDERTGDKRTEGAGVGWRSSSEEVCHPHPPLWPLQSIFKHWMDVTLVTDATRRHLSQPLHCTAFVWFNYANPLCNTVIGKMCIVSEVWHWSRHHLWQNMQRPFKLKLLLR